jgi:hypothetical protein
VPDDAAPEVIASEGVLATSPGWKSPTRGSVTFPLEIGNTWTYDAKFYLHNFDPPELGGSWYADTVSAISVSSVSRSVTIADSIMGFVVDRQRTEGSVTSEGTLLLANLRSGLYTYAYGGYSDDSPPKVSPRQVAFEFHGMKFDNFGAFVRTLTGEESPRPTTASDGLEWEDPPYVNLAYPLRKGQTWTSRTEPFTVSREVMRRVDVTTPAGTFDCFEIIYRWSFDDAWDVDLSGGDYVSRAGYVKRVFDFHGIVITDYEMDTLGTCDGHEEYVLTPNQWH